MGPRSSDSTCMLHGFQASPDGTPKAFCTSGWGFRVLGLGLGFRVRVLGFGFEV